MVCSMTAFGGARTECEAGVLSWELRTVNHRYQDISLKLPESLRFMEGDFRELIGRRIKRGKCDALLRFERSVSGATFTLDKVLAHKLIMAQSELQLMDDALAPLGVGQILAWPGVCTTAEIDGHELGGAAHQALIAALESLMATREREGVALAQVIKVRLEALLEVVREVKEALPQIRAELRSRLEERLAGMGGVYEPNRLEQEMVLYAAKMDVDEELDRLGVHVAEVSNALARTEPIGRRLDFLMQELNREANTLGSKAVDVRISAAAVELKVLIEQMREQVQNIE